MDAKLDKQFDQLYEDDQHQKIVAMIEKIPESDWDLAMIGWYVLSLNNSWRLNDAVEVSLRYQELSKDEPKWYYRLGYAYVNLSRYDEAVDVLLRGKEIARGTEVDDWIDELLEEVEEGREEDLRKAEREARRRAAYKPRDPDKAPFDGFDFTDFWDNCAYSLKEYVGAPLTDEMIADAERELGYKLPEAYIWLMKQQNGGMTVKSEFVVTDAFDDEVDAVTITGIMGLDKSKTYSLTGKLGSQFMIDEWGYPDIGVAIGDCPSAGHDMIFLDYRSCGRDGEPEVVHIDQESDYEITWLAGDFESFIRGLMDDDEIDTLCEE